MILRAFEEESDTYAIIFTKSRISVEVLCNWVNEDADLKWLRAVKLARSVRNKKCKFVHLKLCLHAACASTFASASTSTLTLS